MGIYHKIAEKVKVDFMNAHVKGTRSYAPRPGFYFIKKAYFKPVTDFGELEFALVNWKMKIEDRFVEDVTFDIALSNIFSANGNDTSNLKLEDLNGKMIHLFNPMFENRFFNGIERQVLNCTWKFVEGEPVFINCQAGLSEIFGSKTNINYWHNSQIDGAYDIAAAEEEEVNKVETPVEDPNEVKAKE